MSTKTIVLIGLDEPTIQVIAGFLGLKYQFVAINHKFIISKLSSYDNIILFIINTDQPNINITDLIPKLKIDQSYQNIPIIGLALKQHFINFPSEERKYFEDLLLMPCGNEDLLTRIEIWSRTYELMFSDEINAKTYSLNSI
jgi:hypothetical protein